MSEANVRGWVDRYVKAWNSNDRADIGGLFTDEAAYYTEPYAEPWRGRDRIIEGWVAQKDEPGDATFSYDVVAVVDDLGIVKGRTVYREPPRSYSNLWLVHLDGEGNCTEYTEWWMEEPK